MYANMLKGVLQSSSNRRNNAPLFLDVYPNAKAAFSVRKLREAYSGPCMRVRRTSDNVDAEIGFDSDGWLDTVALLAHVGAGNGNVQLWYDQSGNAKNTECFTSRIVTGGVVLTASNGKPAVHQVHTTTTTTVANVFAVGDTTKSVFEVNYFSAQIGSGSPIMASIGNSNYRSGISGGSMWSMSATGFSTLATPESITGVDILGTTISPTTLTTRVNNTDYTPVVGTLSEQATGIILMRSNGTILGSLGYTQEKIFYAQDFASQLADINDLLNTTYSAY